MQVAENQRPEQHHSFKALSLGRFGREGFLFLPCWSGSGGSCERTGRCGSDIQTSQRAHAENGSKPDLLRPSGRVLFFGQAQEPGRTPRLADSLLRTEGGPKRCVPPDIEKPFLCPSRKSVRAARNSTIEKSVLPRMRLARMNRSFCPHLHAHVFRSPERIERAAAVLAAFGRSLVFEVLP